MPSRWKTPPRARRRRVPAAAAAFTGLSLATAILSVAAPPCHAQQPPRAAAVPPAGALRARLDAIEKAVDQKRRELHIPGAALVVVKDDQIVYLKGLGYKDRENRRPVTPDTLFAIGSSTKAFTAMTALMSQDENKLSLDDPPRKHLPFFRLRDPESDAKLTIRDLLSHRSGLNRTDLLWAGGALTTEELLRAAGAAKPTAKLGEKWQYQNVMFLAAGEAVARAQKMPYPEVVKRRIFAPLGMKASNLSVREMQRAPDHALGYEVNPDTKAVRRLPMRDLTAIAPAGAINSSARDMAQWVRLMLGNGAYGGKRLVSPRAVAEMTRKQIRVGPTMDYGLGWFLRDWNGHKVVEHGGNIDGFNALVALMPDQKLGFVLLTNVSGSPLGETAMETIWTEIVGKPEAPKTAAAAAPAAAPEPEAGTYLLKEANVNAEVVFKEGKLIFTVPGQPPYPLENVGGRRYKLGAPAPAGFFITFRPVKDAPEQTEAFLEQPQGNFVLSRVKAAGDRPPLSPPPVAAAAAAAIPDILGTYHPDDRNTQPGEIKIENGTLMLHIPGTPASPVTLEKDDTLRSKAIPEGATVTLRRDADGKVIGLAVKSPGGGFNATRTPAPLPDTAATAATAAALPSADELLARMIAAAGGEANLKKHRTLFTRTSVVVEEQGLTGETKRWAAAPNRRTEETRLLALNGKKQVAFVRDWFDGASGATESSLSPDQPKTGAALEEARLQAAFLPLLETKTLFKTIEVTKTDAVNGEDVFVVVKTPEKGRPVTDYVSVKTFLVVRRDLFVTAPQLGTALPVTQTYSDFRTVDGMMVPFKIVIRHPMLGEVVETVQEIKTNVAIPADVFRAKPKTK